MEPTQEQVAIIEAAARRPESLMIPALAGTGKTTTIELLAKVIPTRNVLAIAFNKKIAEELIKRLPSHFLVKTMNGLGHTAFQQALGKRLILDDKKISKLVTEFSKSVGGLPDDEWAFLRNLVVRARTLGMVPAKFPQGRKSLLSDDSWGWDTVVDALGGTEELSQQIMTAARDILTKSCEMALEGTIDFDDQIYMSTLFMGVYPRVHTVIVDEAQDLSPLNHLQIKKCMPQRIICVGDPKQAIYAFRGADSASMGKIKALRPDWIELPLQLTFRCPKVVVQRQLTHAPGYKAAETNLEGTLLDLRQEERWTIGKGEEGVKTCLPHAILCRNNAPIISIAFALIRKRIGVQVLGRDFGKSLKTLVKKVCGEDERKEAAVCISELREWKESAVNKARAQDKEERVSRIQDQYESLLAILDNKEVLTLGQAFIWLAELFEERTGQITLSTGHKAKGLEWPTVLHLDPWRIPSKWARLAMDEGNNVPYEQEMNLKYVIETRAKETLILADLEAFE